MNNRAQNDQTTDSQRRDFRGLFPGMFTMGNLLCGFISVISISEGEFITGCWFIILAAALDLLDGKVARIAGASSRFGIELDSLADFSSFGVAPAFLVYSLKLNAMGKWGWVIGVVYIMAASYRLARYNVLATSEEKKNFLGLPVPAAAIALAAYTLFSVEIWGRVEYAEYLVGMIIIFSALMVSQVEYDTVPDRPRPILVLIGIAALVALLLKPRLVLFPLVAAYILFGMTREGLRLSSKGVGIVRSRRSTADNSDENEESL